MIFSKIPNIQKFVQYFAILSIGRFLFSSGTYATAPGSVATIQSANFNVEQQCFTFWYQFFVSTNQIILASYKIPKSNTIFITNKNHNLIEWFSREMKGEFSI